MENVKLLGTESYDSHMATNTSTVNTDIILERGFQKHLSDPTRANGLLDQGRYIKRASKWKWNEREYHVQDNKYVSHTSVKISCATTKFPELSFPVRTQNLTE